MALTTATPMTPDFEVKLLLNSSTALDLATNDPVPSLLEAFSLPAEATPTNINVQFLDTDTTKEIYAAGWSPRIRRMEDEAKKIELTYKKRYPVPLPAAALPIALPPNTTTSTSSSAASDIPIMVYQAAISESLVIAATDGFDSTESDDYDAQVEWGSEKLTLSITRKKKEKAADWGLGSSPGSVELPDEVKSREMLAERAPGKFKNWGGVYGWGMDALKRSRIYGPVFAKRWEGTWEGEGVDLEVWPVRKAGGGDENVDYITEVSFKCDEVAVAKGKQGRLMEVLSAGGWFLEGDSLKTQLIMDWY